jgi:hypothetical protein
MLSIEKTRMRPCCSSGSTALMSQNRSFSRKSAAAVGKSSTGWPRQP